MFVEASGETDIQSNDSPKIITSLKTDHLEVVKSSHERLVSSLPFGTFFS